MRRLIDRVEVRPVGEDKPLAILLHGRRGELLGLPTRTPGQPLGPVSVVAGEGLEPPTLGL